jgi:Ohr subfamily peroxiredoxin
MMRSRCISWQSRFHSALAHAVIHVTRSQADKVRDNEVEVACEVGLLPDGEGGFKLAVTLDVDIAGVDQAKAQAIVKAAHAVCPYSNAIRGNIDVNLRVFAK